MKRQSDSSHEEHEDSYVKSSGLASSHGDSVSSGIVFESDRDSTVASVDNGLTGSIRRSLSSSSSDTSSSQEERAHIDNINFRGFS